MSALRAHLTPTDPVLLNHGGRIVKTLGDGYLVEFPSAAEAVEASVQVQELMHTRNAALPVSRRMRFRIGIHVDDVIVDESGDVFGDGVNIASLLEGVAEPGSIAVSGAVHEAVHTKGDVDFVYDGMHNLKNMSKPVAVWTVGPRSTPSAPTPPSGQRAVATVAVLPFENMSGDADQAYFADGVAEDLLTALARNRYLDGLIKAGPPA